jgi:2-hydroxy-3-keto-5-methylthiopentenyl-1-phosphate phosphatase
MKAISQKSRWPSFLQTFVKWLVKKIVKEEIDQLRSSSISSQLQLNQLWSAGVRVLREFGHTGPATAKTLRREVEWVDLHAALTNVKKVESVSKPAPSVPGAGAQVQQS